MQSQDPSPLSQARAGWRALRIRRDESGATAVEFALLALPFFALLFAILEIALVFWTTQVLETAVADASRQLYTGQFSTTFASAQTAATSNGQPQPTQADTFKSLVCAKASALISCAKIKVDVQAYSTDSFPSGVPSPVQTTPTGLRQYDPAFGHFASPAPSQIMLVRAYAEYPIFTSFLDAAKLSLTPDGRSRLIFATAAFKTEPFSP
jgi:Flp pilus assembly protein TadG